MSLLLSRCCHHTIGPAPSLPSSNHLQVYATLGLFSTLSLCYFTWFAINTEDTFQLVATQVTEILFTSFVVFQVFHNPHSLGSLWETARFGIMGVKLFFQLVILGFFYPVWQSFGFYRYKIVGADSSMRKRFTQYTAFLTVMKYDLYCSMMLLLLAKVYLLSEQDADLYLGIASLLLSILFFVLGWYAVTTEQGKLTAAFLVCATLQPAYGEG